MQNPLLNVFLGLSFGNNLTPNRKFNWQARENPTKRENTNAHNSVNVQKDNREGTLVILILKIKELVYSKLPYPSNMLIDLLEAP